MIFSIPEIEGLPWDAKEVTIGQTNLIFHKLLFPQQRKAMEIIRPRIIGFMARMAAGEVDEDGNVINKPTPQDFFEALNEAIDSDDLERLAKILLQGVQFTNPSVTIPAKVGGRESEVFQAAYGMEAVHWYEVVGRAFAVNFTDSLTALRSRYMSRGASQKSESLTSLPK